MYKIKIDTYHKQYKQKIYYKLHKLYNTKLPHMEGAELNFNQTSTSTKFNTVKSNNYLIGNNLRNSRLAILNSKVTLTDLNLYHWMHLK